MLYINKFFVPSIQTTIQPITGCELHFYFIGYYFMCKFKPRLQPGPGIEKLPRPRTKFQSFVIYHQNCWPLTETVQFTLQAEARAPNNRRVNLCRIVTTGNSIFSPITQTSFTELNSQYLIFIK